MELEGIEDVYELSPIQEGLLFHNLYSPGSGIYLEQVTLELHGPLEVAAFGRSWQAIVDRHPILRTSVHWEGAERALQVVHREVPFPIEVLDWRDVDESTVSDRHDELGRTDRMRGFDYAVAPLMRGYLIRYGDERWEFFWSFSHLLMDGWSFGLAFAELAALYTGYATDTDPGLAPARPYRDYLAWWKDRDRAATEEFWRGYLAGHQVPEALELGAAPAGPLDPDQPSHAVLPTPELLDLLPGLADFAREYGLTLNTIMQGAWMVVMARHLGRADVVTGSTGTQRPASLPGAEQIMGPMLATMPVRARVEDDAELIGWLRELQTGMAQAREHADISLTDLRALADLPGNRPVFEVDLAFENVPVPDLRLADVTVAGSTYDGRPHFPITMIVMPGESMPEPRLVYDATRFTETAVRRLVDQFAAVLVNMTRYPGLRLGELDIMPPEQWQQVILDFAASTPVPVTTTLEAIIAGQAATTPHAVAVICGEDQISYGDLADRAHQLAHHLRSLGVARGDRVGLCLDRSIDLIVGVLGVLAAGAAYVPLDLGHPLERMAFLLADAEVDVLVTHAGAGGRAPREAVAIVVDLDADRSAIAARPADPPVTGVQPDDPAYLIYTSGSTGRPKGVLVSHANVVRLIAGAGTRFTFSAADTISLFHSYAFDVSVFEIWTAFANGARLLVVPHDTARQPDALRDLVAGAGVTVFSQTPSAFRSFAAAALADGRPLPDLRYVVFAGEQLDLAMLEPWLDRFGDESPELINMYGITEVTVHATYHRVRVGDLAGSVRSNVGRPLPDLRIYLLDSRMVPVPPGMTGEIYVAGPGVVLGYHNQPELTAERFLLDLYAGEIGHRMYRSGDLARWTEAGDLEFLGRADRQVKIRGYRVEPGEVEAVLRALPDVADAVVIPRQVAGDTRLVAYLVAADGAEADGRVRERIRDQVPEYLVPSQVVWLDGFPLTANGKIDLLALPSSDGERPEGADGYIEPQTEAERAVAEVWCELLGVERVGADDDFFALGGHSLLATRVVFALRGRLGVEVPVRAVFDRPRLADVAAAVEAAGYAPSTGPAPVIARRPRVTQRI